MDGGDGMVISGWGHLQSTYGANKEIPGTGRDQYQGPNLNPNQHLYQRSLFLAIIIIDNEQDSEDGADAFDSDGDEAESDDYDSDDFTDEESEAEEVEVD